MKMSKRLLGLTVSSLLIANVLTVGTAYAANNISVLTNASAGSTVTLSGSYTGSAKMSKNGVTVKATGATLNAGTITITGSNNKITGLKITNAPDTALMIRNGAQNNYITNVTVDGANDYGIACRDSGTKNNTFDSCHSQYNYDTDTKGGNADGFGNKFSAGANIWKGCVAYNNSDDGWDAWKCGSGTNQLTNCTADHNGYTKSGGHNSSMNGEGFKCGGTGATGSWIFTSCHATNNYQSGWKRNHTTGTITLNGCTESGNGEPDLLGPND